MEEAKNFPTMIIPNGTDVSVNEHGQLSIRTPGNLVIQNSGVYSVIESASGSVRIGAMLDTNLETEIDGLFVCDASVFPESLDRPTVLTIISLAKRFSNYWIGSHR